MVDNEFGDNITESTPEKPTTPPRRRRAASRPAGPPQQGPVQAGSPAEPAEPSAAEAAPAAEAPTAPKTPRRRRPAAKADSAPEAPLPATDPAAEPAPAATPEADVAAEPATEPAELPAKRPTRRRATRAAAPAEPAAETPEAATPEAADQAAAVPDAEPAVGPEQKAPQRRRRATRPAAAPEPAAETAVAETDVVGTAADETEDAIAVALRMAERAARSRVDAEGGPLSRDRRAELDALADEIASDDEIAAATEVEGETDEGAVESEAADGAEEVDGEAAEEAGDETAADEGEDEASHEEGDRGRRRRRRGGRRRRRGSSRGETGDAEESSDDDGGAEDEEHGEEADSEGEESDGAETTTRRRRRRRRGSRSEDDGHDDGHDEITGIEGSTRMEAKRQRRKENRAAGRRRAPILSEAEFLARRESVDRKLVIRQSADYTQLAVVEDGILVEHYVDKESATSLIGNVYLGKVQNVLPSMEAAFIDIGRGRNAVLYAGEVDWDSFGVTAEDRKVEKVLKSGQAVVVQVTKDPIGAKGARLTGHISLPGRYIVYSPGGHLSGISRKLPDVERARLKGILGELISDDESVVVRTAAEGVGADELVRDVNRLKAQWEVIEKKVKQGRAPQALYSEPDLTLRIVRDLFTEDFAKLIVQGDGGPEDAFDEISAYVNHIAPHLADRMEQFTPGDDGKDVFSQYRIDEQIAKALDRKVFLPSGGSLIFDRTEAMTVIDVNTGRFTGAGGNLEATVTSNNLEAAEEIVRQLRLRDLGGIIVIDFIDMVLASNRELLLRRLVECLGRDRTRHQVAEVTSLGLVQLTRKRIGTGLAEAFTEKCECCGGSGYHRFEEPVESQAPADGGDRRHGGRNGRRRGGGHGESH